jgi:hypothetical protein
VAPILGLLLVLLLHTGRVPRALAGAVGKTRVFAASPATPAQGIIVSVNLQTSGCVGGWTLRRTGRYSDGVLELDRPVLEYCPVTYQKLYAIRVAGQAVVNRRP